MGMCLLVTVRAHMQFNSKLVVKSHTDVLMWDQSGHQLAPLWQSWILFYRPAVTMAWQVCFHGNTFVTTVEHGQSVGGESPMRTVGLEGKLITLMMIQSLSSGRMRKSLLLLRAFSFPCSRKLPSRIGVSLHKHNVTKVTYGMHKWECQCFWDVWEQCGGIFARWVKEKKWCGAPLQDGIVILWKPCFLAFNQMGHVLIVVHYISNWTELS